MSKVRGRKERRFGHARAPLAIRPEAFGFLFALSEPQATAIVNGVAIVCIDGPLEHKAGWFWDSYECIAQRFADALYNPDARAVLLKIDSPGGDVAGLIETVRELRALKADAGKPVYAYADEAAYSAGYALACIADEIYLPDSAGVGSIGVICALCDETKFDEEMGFRYAVISSGSRKTDGNPHVPISDEAVERQAEHVNDLAALFFDVVSESRGLSVDAISALEAGCFHGADAVSNGLADGVMGLSDLISTIQSTFDEPEKAPVEEGAGDQAMRGTLAAKKSLDEARAALASARTDADRSAAVAGLAKAEAAYKAAKDAPAPGKSKAAKVTVDTEDKEGKGDKYEKEKGKEDAAESAPESSKESSKPESSKAAESSGDSSEDSSSSSDSSSMTSSEMEKAGEDDAAAIAAAARKVTGRKSSSAVVGALYALGDQARDGRNALAELKAMKEPTLHAMVQSAIKEGRLQPSREKWAIELGRENLKSLKVYLDQSSKKVARVEDGGHRPPKDADRREMLTSAESKIAGKLHLDPEKIAAHKAKRTTLHAVGDK